MQMPTRPTSTQWPPPLELAGGAGHGVGVGVAV